MKVYRETEYFLNMFSYQRVYSPPYFLIAALADFFLSVCPGKRLKVIRIMLAIYPGILKDRIIPLTKIYHACWVLGKENDSYLSQFFPTWDLGGLELFKF